MTVSNTDTVQTRFYNNAIVFMKVTILTDHILELLVEYYQYYQYLSYYNAHIINT